MNITFQRQQIKKQESNKKKRKHSWKISAEPRQDPQDDDDDGDDDGRLTGEQKGEQTGECSTVSLFGLIELQREKVETEQKKLAGECESKVDGKRPLSAQVNIIIDQGKASGGKASGLHSIKRTTGRLIDTHNLEYASRAYRIYIYS